MTHRCSRLTYPMQPLGLRFVQLHDITQKHQPTLSMCTPPPQKARFGKQKAPIKKLSKRNLKGFTSHLVPSSQSSQPHDTRHTNDDLTNRAVGLEPHYDIEHFIPEEDGRGYRGVLQRSPVRPKHINSQRRNVETRSVIPPTPASPTHTYNYSQGASATMASYVHTTRDRETIPNPTNHIPYPYLTDHYELAAPSPKNPFIRDRIPKISITPSSPTIPEFKFDVLDNSRLAPPPICYKRKERRRQVRADEARMMELLRSRRAGSFDATGMQMDVRPITHVGGTGKGGVQKRVRRGVEPCFERYAYSLFG